MPTPKTPPCPVCQRSRDVVIGAGKPGERLYYCQRCGGLFDDTPNEAGDYSDRNPAARMIREEERKKRRA